MTKCLARALFEDDDTSLEIDLTEFLELPYFRSDSSPSFLEGIVL